MKKISLLLIALFLTSVVSAQHYMLEAEILKNGNLIGSPAIMATLDKKIELSEDDDKGNAYSFLFMLRQHTGGNVAFASKLTINGEVITPRVILEPGKQAVIKIGKNEVRLTVSHQ